MTTVASLDVYKRNDVAAGLRQLANQQEDPRNKKAARVIVIIETEDGSFQRVAFATKEFTNAMAIGLCVMAIKELTP